MRRAKHWRGDLVEIGVKDDIPKAGTRQDLKKLWEKDIIRKCTVSTKTKTPFMEPRHVLELSRSNKI